MGQWNVRSDRCLFHIELFKAMCFLVLFSFPLLGIKSGGRTWSNHFGPRGRSFVIRKVEGHYQCWPVYFWRVIQERNRVLSCLRQCILGPLCYSKETGTKLSCPCPGYLPCAFRSSPLCSIPWVVDHDGHFTQFEFSQWERLSGNWGERGVRMVSSLHWCIACWAKGWQWLHYSPGDDSSRQGALSHCWSKS